MVIKKANDVIELLNNRWDEVNKLSCCMRELVLDWFMSMYHELTEAERYRYEYRWAREKETKSRLKSGYALMIKLAENSAAAIDRELERIRKDDAE